MWERTVTIGSAGKVFSSTGAKVKMDYLFKLELVGFNKALIQIDRLDYWA